MTKRQNFSLWETCLHHILVYSIDLSLKTFLGPRWMDLNCGVTISSP